MAHLSARWTLVSCLVTVTLHFGGPCLLAQPTPPVSQPALDLSNPKKTFETVITAVMRNDPVTLKVCMYFPDKTDGALVDAMIALNIAKHQLGQAAVAAFGQAGTSLLNAPGTFDADLKKNLDKMMNGIVEINGDTATLRESGTRGGQSAEFRKIEGLWKLDESHYVAAFAKDAEQRRAEMLATARAMDELAKQIRDGAFKDVEEAKTAWALKKTAATTAPTTGPTTKTGSP